MRKRSTVPERGPVLGCGVTERQSHRVRARPVVVPTAKPFEPGEFGLPRPARLDGGLMGQHLTRGRIDPPPAQRGRHTGLLQRSVRQVAIRGEVAERALRALDGLRERGSRVERRIVEHALPVGGFAGAAVILDRLRRRLRG